MSGCCCFPGFVILPVRIHCIVCLVLCLVMIFLLELLALKNLFSQPFRAWPSVVSYFRGHCEGRKKRIDPSHESVQSLHFSTWRQLEAIFFLFFFQIKGSIHEINLLCDRKYKHYVGENRKV